MADVYATHVIHVSYLMDTTVMGVFNDHRTAEQVKAALIDSGLAEANISFYPSSERSGAADRTAEDDKGFWASLKALYTDGEDVYAAHMEGVRRGGVMVIAATTTDRAQAVAEVMKRLVHLPSPGDPIPQSPWDLSH